MKERQGLRFRHTTEAGVDAAQRAVDAAKLAKERECGNGDPRQRGTFCRQREEAEATALAAAAATNKATTDRFDEIEVELKRLRSLKSEGEVSAVNPLRDLLGTIVGAWADVLTAWQKAVLAVIYDVCLIAVMVGIEVLGHTQTPQTRLAKLSTRSRSSSRNDLRLYPNGPCRA